MFQILVSHWLSDWVPYRLVFLNTKTKFDITLISIDLYYEYFQKICEFIFYEKD